MEIEELCKTIEPFDIPDFLARISSLRVLFENQDKALLFDELEKALLKHKESFEKGKPPMGPEKFRAVIQGLENCSLAINIDPPEYPFVESVFVPEERHLFQGINGAQAYFLQHFFDALTVPGFGMDPLFVSQARAIIRAIASLSEYLYQYSGANFENFSEFSERPTIATDGPQKELFFISKDYFVSRFKDSFPEIREWLFYDGKDEEESEAFKKPFLVDEDNVIILDPSALGLLAIHLVLLLAEARGQKEILLSIYNLLCWQDALMDLRRLTDSKIILDSSSTTPSPSPFQSALLLTPDGHSLAVVGFFDTGESSKAFPITAMRGISIKEKIANRCLKGFRNAISAKALDPKKMYSATILFGFGRTLQVKSSKKLSEKNLDIGAQDLSYIPGNEKGERRFLFDYLDLKSATLKTFSPMAMFGDMYAIAFYSENHHSFYCDDEVNMRNTMVSFSFNNGYSYKVKSRLETAECIVPHPFYPTRRVLVERNERNIYFLTPHFDNHEFVGEVALFPHFSIWVYFVTKECPDGQTFNCLGQTMDVISYWLSEMPRLFREITSIACNRIKLVFQSTKKPFFTLSSSDSEILVQVSDFSVWPNAKNNDNNQDEKDLMMGLFAKFGLPAELVEKARALFANPKKKKMFEAVSELGPYLVSDSTNGPEPVYPSNAYEEEVLDDLGAELKKKADKGLISPTDGEGLLHEAVRALYARLNQETQGFDHRSLLEAVYQNVERSVSELEFLKRDKQHGILLYPEKSAGIIERFYNASSASACSHNLLEFVSAIATSGSKECTASDIANLLGIINEICAYGSECDLIHYHLCENGVHLLNSGRLETKSEVQEKIIQINEDFSLLEETSNVPSLSPGIDELLKTETDQAFEEGYGFTFKDLRMVVQSLQDFDPDRRNIVKKAKISTLLAYLSEKCPTIPKERVAAIVDSLSAKKRANFFDPSPLQERETYPWRTNRMLSILRKPLVVVADEFWWGNESLFLTLLFHVNALTSGTERTPLPSTKMNALMGHVKDYFGNDFNDKVYAQMRTFQDFVCYKNVKKFGKNRLVDEHNNDIGDIDILSGCPKQKKVFVIETKCYRRALNPYQIAEEMEKVFSSKKTSMLNKHKRRFLWVNDNRNLLSLFFPAFDDSWEIIPLMVTSSLLISCPFAGIKENIISAKELTPDYLSNFHQ